MEAKLDRLSLKVASNADPKDNKSSRSKSKSKQVADSWEEDSLSGSGSDAETGEYSSTQHGPEHHGRSSLTGAKLPIPNAPPPTPISPDGRGSAFKDWASTYSSNSPRTSGPMTSSSVSSDKRPEKTTAAANRMIAGALGVRAPPKTEEQRAYERAVKEGEIRRKEREKAEKRREAEDDERARASVWDG